MGGDDFTSFGAANEATKKSDNKRPPNDEETHIKQPEDSVGDGGRLLRDVTAAERMGGDDFTSFGAANEATK
jgi:hypothetical protein